MHSVCINSSPSLQGCSQFISKSALMSGVASTQVQPLVLELVELYEVLMGALTKFVQVPLNGIPSFCCVNFTIHLCVI